MPENDEGAKWKKSKEAPRFICARPGDLLGSPFQCDHCWFVNIKKTPPEYSSLSDRRFLGYIRRVNLDVMWSREKGTVGNILSTVKKGKQLSLELGCEPLPLTMGPWKVDDDMGMQMAIELLRASQRPGKNDKEYVQFDSIRKLRSAYANVFEASPDFSSQCLVMKGDKGRTFQLTNMPSDSILFRRFMLGCEKRMGRLVIQERGISIEMMLGVMNFLEHDLNDAAVDQKRKRDIIVGGAALVILYAGALRGGEIFLLEASELVKRCDYGKKHPTLPHVTAPLMGRFKNETGERNVLIPLPNVTASGLAIRLWVERLVNLLISEGRHKEVGPAICDYDGFVMPRARVNFVLHSALKKLQAERTDIVPLDMDVENDTSIHRGARRGAHTRAKEAGVPEPIINLNNRWRKSQSRSGSMPKLSMSELYMEITQSLKSKLTFALAL